jgi:hypothetical protein
MPTSISVMRTPEAEIGHDAPVSLEELQLPTVVVPPSPHGTNEPVPESADPPLDALPPPDPLPLDPPLLPPLLLPLAPELGPELLPPEPGPELLPPEPPRPEPPPLDDDAPPGEGTPQSAGAGALPHAAASTKPATPTAALRPPKRTRVEPKKVFSRFVFFAFEPVTRLQVQTASEIGSGFVHVVVQTCSKRQGVREAPSV